MKNRILKILKYLLVLLPMVLSVGLLSILIWTLACKLNTTASFAKTLTETRTYLLTVSGLLSGLIIAYLTSKVLQIRQEKIARVPQLKEQTQKLHKCRSIMNKLLHSQLWLDGLKNFVNNTYNGLTHFDVRKISKLTKQASDFVQDHEFGDTANLYLELKSFMSSHPLDHTLYAEFDVPIYYSSEIVQKWIDSDCGNGLYYYFDYKYAFYKDDLRLHNVDTGYQEEIKETSLKIDHERYKDLDFGPELLSKLGTQLTSDILPRLIRLQRFIDEGLPKIINYLFIVVGLLIVFGVALPLIGKLYNLSPIFDIVSVSVTISISFYLLTSFYGFMKREIKI